MKEYVYADNAATTRLSNKAFESMLPYLQNEYGNASQLYSFARLPKKALKEARQVIANCIGAQPSEIFLLLVVLRVTIGLLMVLFNNICL